MLFEHAKGQLHDRRRHVGPTIEEIRWRRLEVGLDALRKLALGERRASRQQVVERAAERIDVGAGVGRVAVAGLLGREVVGRAEHLLVVGLRERRVVLFLGERETEVEDLDRAAGVEDQVRGLDVAMHEPLLVRMLEPERRLPHVVECVAERERAGLLDLRMEVGSGDVLHRDEMDLAGGVEVERPDDVRMVQPGGGAGLALESGEVRRLVDTMAWQHLDRDLVVERRVFGEIDAAHAPLAEEPQQPVFPEHEALVPAATQLIGLPLREQLPLDEVRDEVVWQRQGAVRPGGRSLLEPVVVLHQPALADHGKKLVDREGDGVAHRSIQGTRPTPLTGRARARGGRGHRRAWRPRRTARSPTPRGGPRRRVPRCRRRKRCGRVRRRHGRLRRRRSPGPA